MVLASFRLTLDKLSYVSYNIIINWDWSQDSGSPSGREIPRYFTFCMKGDPHMFHNHQPDPTIICFYHEYEENGHFSNWYPAEFDYAGVHFTSAEQCY